MIALVEVSYKDSGASMAGSGSGSIARAEVYEVVADSVTEAEGKATDIVKRSPMVGGVRARFLRWCNREAPSVDKTRHPMAEFLAQPKD
jgi:hypothetical protein